MNQRKPGRGASRFLASLPAVLHTEQGDFACSASDLSRSGVLLVGKLPVPSRPEVRFTLSSGAGDLKLVASGRVMRLVAGTGDADTQLGVEFDALDDSAHLALEGLVSRVIEGAAPAALESLPANATPQQIRETLEKVPLAHRMAMATRGIPREREILMKDPHPQVLDALARNPGLLLAEVRALLRLRTLLPGTMRTLARDPRWSGNEPVRILIASHPSTPLSLAKQLVSNMSPDAVRKLVQQPGLNPALRLELGRGIARGKPGRG